MKRAVWAVILLAGFTGTALADDEDLRKRVAELEQKLEALLKEKAAEVKPPPPPPPAAEQHWSDLEKRLGAVEKSQAEAKPEAAPSPSRIDAEFKDGLKFKSADGNFDAHIGGRLLTHYRAYFDRPKGADTSPDTFFVRQARLEMSGTFYKDWEFKVQADFPTGAAAISGTLQDAYLGWKRHKALSLRVGQFKVPFSQEETTTTRFIDFPERSIVNRLAPARDIGLMAYGKLFDGILEYEAGVFNGQGRAVVDGDDQKETALRLRVNPFLKCETEWLKGLRLGVAGTISDLDAASLNGLDFTSTELAVRFLDATAGAGTIDGIRTRLGAEMSYLYGPFSFRAEYVRRTDEIDVVATAIQDADIQMDAWYAAATWLLTGEKKSLEGRTVPEHPFDPSEGHWGAFEVAARFASLSIDDEIFDSGAAPAAGNANGMHSATIGLNWYLTRNVRISPVLVWERYADDVTFTTRSEDSANGAIVRFQIDF